MRDIDPTWWQMAGFHAEESGISAAVWLACDPLTRVTWLTDACLFRKEPMEMIGAALNQRGKWIPVAWHKEAKPFVDQLQKDRGINVLPDPCNDSPAYAEQQSRELLSMIRSALFFSAPHVVEWREEFDRFSFSEDQKVVREGFPLMAATRHAIEMLPYGRPESFGQKKQSAAPKVSIF